MEGRPWIRCSLPVSVGRAVQNSEQSIAFFDLDHALVDGDSDTSFVHFLHDRGLLSAELLAAKGPIHAAYLRGEPWQDEYELLIARHYGGRRVDEVRALAEEHAHDRVLPRLFPGARALVERERSRRGAVALLTTTNDAVTAPIAAALGLDPLLSTRLVSVDGRYTGALADGFCTGPGKARALLAHCERVGVDPRACAMFGDGRSDMEALEVVGTPVAVHPNGALARRAAEAGWTVLDLSETPA